MDSRCAGAPHGQPLDVLSASSALVSCVESASSALVSCLESASSALVSCGETALVSWTAAVRGHLPHMTRHFAYTSGAGSLHCGH
jgi:hypothetical protein